MSHKDYKTKLLIIQSRINWLEIHDKDSDEISRLYRSMIVLISSYYNNITD